MIEVLTRVVTAVWHMLVFELTNVAYLRLLFLLVLPGLFYEIAVPIVVWVWRQVSHTDPDWLTRALEWLGIERRPD